MTGARALGRMHPETTWRLHSQLHNTEQYSTVQQIAACSVLCSWLCYDCMGGAAQQRVSCAIDARSAIATCEGLGVQTNE